MELFKTSEENIDKLIRKGLNSKSWIFHPDKFITDFIYPISQYKGEDMTANRLKFIVFTILSLDK